MKIPSKLVELGLALELDTNLWEWTWNLSDKMKLFSNVSGNKLILVYAPVLGKSKGPVISENGDFAKARALYSKFQGFKSDKTNAHKVIDSKLKRAGVANFICYRSEKFGSKVDYKHDFKCSPAVWVDNNLPHIIVISSSKLRVTRRGIEG